MKNINAIAARLTEEEYEALYMEACSRLYALHSQPVFDADGDMAEPDFPEAEIESVMIQIYNN